MFNHGWWRLAVGGWWRLPVGGWRLAAVGGSWQLVMGGWWRLAAVDGWRLVAVGGWQRLAVGGWWRLAVGGSWRLAVGGPLGRSLRAVLKKKKSGPLRTALSPTPHDDPLGQTNLFFEVCIPGEIFVKKNNALGAALRPTS